MKDTILSYIVVALGCVCIALALVTWRIKRTARNDALEAFERQYKALLEENKRLDVHDTLTLCYADGLEQEVEHLQSQIADLEEWLKDAHAEIKALHMATVEMPEVPTAAPIAVKRVRGKKAGSE